MDDLKIMERLDRLLDTVVTRTGVQGVVMGVASGDATFKWTGASGYSNADATRLMMPGTPFFIASVTKMFTASVTMMLHERAVLDLNDLVVNYLPRSLTDRLHVYKGRDYSLMLTVRHLIAQTTGFPDYFLERPRGRPSILERLVSEGERAWPLEEVVTYMKTSFSPKFPPATYNPGGTAIGRYKARYSDLNYKLLGAILEAVCNKPLQCIFDEFILNPLGLEQTYVYGHRLEDASDSPADLYYKGVTFKVEKAARSHGPEGGMVSTVSDLLRFGQAFMKGKLFSLNTLALMKQWRRIFYPIRYGYGLMQFRIPWYMAPGSPEFVGHSGSSGSFLFYSSRDDLYMAGTINEFSLRQLPFRIMLRAIHGTQTRFSGVRSI